MLCIEVIHDLCFLQRLKSVGEKLKKTELLSQLFLCSFYFDYEFPSKRMSMFPSKFEERKVMHSTIVAESKVPLKKRQIRDSLNFLNSKSEHKILTDSLDKTTNCTQVETDSLKFDSPQDLFALDKQFNEQFKTHSNSVRENLWNNRYKELVEFRNKHGHCNVPQRYESNRALGKWVHKQKHLLRNKGGILREDRVHALYKIGFIELFQQNTSSVRDNLWNKRYNELIEFIIQEGHCNVPQRYASNKALGKWVHKQKQLLQNKGGILREDRVQALANIGFMTFCFSRSKMSLNGRHAEIFEFQRINRRCDVTQRCPPNTSLGKQVHHQRQVSVPYLLKIENLRNWMSRYNNT